MAVGRWPNSLLALRFHFHQIQMRSATLDPSSLGHYHMQNKGSGVQVTNKTDAEPTPTSSISLQSALVVARIFASVYPVGSVPVGGGLASQPHQGNQLEALQIATLYPKPCATHLDVPGSPNSRET
jgi:hypothetical protein